MLALASINHAVATEECAPAPVTYASAMRPDMFFAKSGKNVLTFIGYSAAGYQSTAAMLAIAENTLNEFEPSKTLINIGATPEGIGAVYKLAKGKGFETTGIVSTEAQKSGAPTSAFVDHVFYIEDSRWGGLIPGTDRLSPTSEAMVRLSDVIVGIGGGDIARDELLLAKRQGKMVRFFPADMNHQQAIETAVRKGLERPTDFRGAANSLRCLRWSSRSCA